MSTFLFIVHLTIAFEKRCATVSHMFSVYVHGDNHFLHEQERQVMTQEQFMIKQMRRYHRCNRANHIE